jgi:tRNA modification GTPase
VLTYEQDDCICALATPNGTSALAIVRLSGKNSIKIARQLARLLPDNPESHRNYLCQLYSNSGEFLDQAIVGYYAEGTSFTGEESFEFTCHGNQKIIQEILENLIRFGARLARPGEFSLRAFLNGKIDLLQAESINQLIHANSEAVLKEAKHQYRGKLSKEIREIQSLILKLLGKFELEIDFTEQGIEAFSKQSLNFELQTIVSRLRQLIDGFEWNKWKYNGVRVTLAGLPNAGKSSLFNALIDEDRAIVSEIPGTTRDLVRGQYEFDGVEFDLADSAGIRETIDPVEERGISKSLSSIDQSDVVVIVHDVRDLFKNENSLDELESRVKKSVQDFNHKKKILFLNKIDEVSENELNLVSELVSKIYEKQTNPLLDVIVGSAIGNAGTVKLKKTLVEIFKISRADSEGVLLSARHVTEIEKCLKALKMVEEMLENSVSPEIIAMEMKESIDYLGGLIGSHVTDEVLSQIFNDFCIGK